MKPLLLLAMAALAAAQVDWSQNGRNWNDTQCLTNPWQSPINLEPASMIPTNQLKYVLNYRSYDNLTIFFSPTTGYYGVNMSAFMRDNTLTFWNPLGERFDYFLEGYTWKVPSEHTVDNRVFSAELQISHRQFATQRKVIISVLFDEEIYLKASAKNKLKTCFVESFFFSNYTSKAGDLEIPLREYL